MQVNFSTVIVLNHKHDPIHMPKFKCKWKKKGGGGGERGNNHLSTTVPKVGLIIIQTWNLTPQVMANQAYTCESNHCTQICWRHHRFTAEVFSSCRILKERERESSGNIEPGKKELVESANGHIPAEISLFSLGTAGDQSASAHRAGQFRVLL